MIEISFAAGMTLVGAGYLVFRGTDFLKRGKVDWKNECRQILFLFNLLVIVRFTFYPFAKVNGQIQPLLFDPSAAFPFRVNLIPFINLLDYDSRRDLLINLIGNFAMFIPTGVITPMIYKKRDSLKKTVLTGFGISLAIELIQLPFAVRASDVDDLILNTLGCLTGYGIYALCRRINRKRGTDYAL